MTNLSAQAKRRQHQRLATLERELVKVKGLLDQVLADQSLTVSITTLEPSPLRLVRDIPVVIQPTGDDYVATFFDANISATGDTETEAVANLKDIVTAKFEMLDGMPLSKLGKGPRNQLAVLRKVIRRKGANG